MTTRLRVVPGVVKPKANFFDWTEAKGLIFDLLSGHESVDETARRIALWAREKYEEGYAEGVRAVLGDKADEALAKLKNRRT